MAEWSRPMPGESDVGAEVSADLAVLRCDSAPPADRQILQVLTELRTEVSALRTELLGQNQQMLSRMQFLHEALLGRIKQLRESGLSVRRRLGRT
jgi:hypothetical protein